MGPTVSTSTGLIRHVVGLLAAVAPCISPVEYSSLKPATYTLSVRGTDPAGNESNPDTYTWTVAKGGGRP
jgi:hypothetical protein